MHNIVQFIFSLAFQQHRLCFLCFFFSSVVLSTWLIFFNCEFFRNKNFQAKTVLFSFFTAKREREGKKRTLRCGYVLIYIFYVIDTYRVQRFDNSEVGCVQCDVIAVFSRFTNFFDKNAKTRRRKKNNQLSVHLHFISFGGSFFSRIKNQSGKIRRNQLHISKKSSLQNHFLF